MSIDPNSRIRIADRVRARPVGESVVIVSMAGSEIFELTGSGVRVWELLEAGTSAGELLAALDAEYGEATSARDDTVRLLGELEAAGLIVVDGP